MRLIDADAFIEEARNRIDMQDMYLPIHIKETVLDEMPTIDAVPVIRCKDCRFYETHSFQGKEFRLCGFGFPTRADDFCSWSWTGRKEE